MSALNHVDWRVACGSVGHGGVAYCLGAWQGPIVTTEYEYKLFHLDFLEKEWLVVNWPPTSGGNP